MFMKIRGITAAVLLLLAAAAFAKEYDSKGLFMLGDGAAALGRGGTGVAASGADLLYLNPAAAAGLERAALSLQYGNLGGGVYNPNVSFAVPTDWGTLGGSFRFLSAPKNTAHTKTLLGLSIGMGREIAERISLGLGINTVWGKNPHGSSVFFGGFNAGGVYKFTDVSFGSHFGLFKPAVGLSLTAGIPFAGGFNVNQITLGYKFKFFSNEFVGIGLYNDLSFINLYKGFPLKFGGEICVMDKFVLRAGGILFNEYEFASVTAGAGYVLAGDAFACSIDYGFGYGKKSGAVHYIGVTGEYGGLDREPPKITVKPSEEFISPNNDGVKDYVRFYIDAKDKSHITGWQLQIISSEGNTVKEYRTSERDIVRRLTFGEFMKSLFSKRQSLNMPDYIDWDGRDETGSVVWDGVYRCTFAAVDEKGNKGEAKATYVTVDTVSPNGVVFADEAMFSPNGDGVKDRITVRQDIATNPEDKWNARFITADGVPVKSLSWDGVNIPSALSWDGTTDSGEEASEGLYFYELAGEDFAGNSCFSMTREIALTRKYQIADVRLDKGYLSYSGSGAKLNLRFNLSVSDTEGLKGYRLLVLDTNKRTVFDWDGSGLPAYIDWNCLIADDKPLPDGNYFVRLTVFFESGNAPSSFDKRFVVASSAPVLTLNCKPETFSPDGDGENDTLSIFPEARSAVSLSEWNIDIKPLGDKGAAFKRFSGTGALPPEIRWDGIGDSGDIVESASDYELVLSAVDVCGNKATSAPCKISVDILVAASERGLKMRVSNITFASGSDTMSDTGRGVLDKVYSILKVYAKYDIVIEGHTDDLGDEDYNKGLSQKRAEAVMKYLADKGISGKRMQAVGLGESFPLYPNTSDENRRRNRRVEFILINNSKKAEQG